MSASINIITLNAIGGKCQEKGLDAHAKSFAADAVSEIQLSIIEMPSSNIGRHEMLEIQFALNVYVYSSGNSIIVIKLVKDH